MRNSFIVLPETDTADSSGGGFVLPPFPDDCRCALFGMGCFWGAERCFQQLAVYGTAVGYSGGTLAGPSYRDICSGHTGHAEVVLVVYRPKQVDYKTLLGIFWEKHDPTQGMRQGNDRGSQYRSVIYSCEAGQEVVACASRAAYQAALEASGSKKTITTEIASVKLFYYAEAYHQQYLVKNPQGYCGLGGLGVPYPASN